MFGKQNVKAFNLSAKQYSQYVLRPLKYILKQWIVFSRALISYWISEYPALATDTEVNNCFSIY